MGNVDSKGAIVANKRVLSELSAMKKNSSLVNTSTIIHTDSGVKSNDENANPEQIGKSIVKRNLHRRSRAMPVLAEQDLAGLTNLNAASVMHEPMDQQTKEQVMQLVSTLQTEGQINNPRLAKLLDSVATVVQDIDENKNSFVENENASKKQAPSIPSKKAPANVVTTKKKKDIQKKRKRAKMTLQESTNSWVAKQRTLKKTTLGATLTEAQADEKKQKKTITKAQQMEAMARLSAPIVHKKENDVVTVKIGLNKTRKKNQKRMKKKALLAKKKKEEEELKKQQQQDKSTAMDTSPDADPVAETSAVQDVTIADAAAAIVGESSDLATEVQEQWQELMDPATNHVYYWNQATNMTSWVLPEGCFIIKPNEKQENADVVDYSIASTHTKKMVRYHRSQQSLSFSQMDIQQVLQDVASVVKPEDAWQEFFDDKTQRHYYYNALTEERTWIDPRPQAQIQVSSSSSSNGGVNEVSKKKEMPVVPVFPSELSDVSLSKPVLAAKKPIVETAPAHSSDLLAAIKAKRTALREAPIEKRQPVKSHENELADAIQLAHQNFLTKRQLQMEKRRREGKSVLSPADKKAPKYAKTHQRTSSIVMKLMSRRNFIDGEDSSSSDEEEFP